MNTKKLFLLTPLFFVISAHAMMTNEPTRLLVTACRANDITAAEQALKNKANANGSYDFVWQFCDEPMLAAIEKDNVGLYRLLRKWNARTTWRRNYQNQGATYEAVLRGRLNVLRALLEDDKNLEQAEEGLDIAKFLRKDPRYIHPSCLLSEDKITAIEALIVEFKSKLTNTK